MKNPHGRSRAAGFLLAAMASYGATATGQNGDPGLRPASVDCFGDALPKGAIARLGTIRFRHDAACVAWSPDGAILASGGEDNQIRLFDPTSGKLVRTLRGHDRRTYTAKAEPGKADDVLVEATGQGQVNALSFTPDGRILASGGWDDSIRLWDVPSGEPIRRIEAHRGMVASVAFSGDGKLLASRGGIDGMVKLWNPETGAELRRFEGLSRVNPWRFNRDAPLAFSPDGTTLAVGDKQVIHFFDVPSGAERTKWDAHPTCVFLAYSHDGVLLATSGIDGEDLHSLRIWEVASGKELRRCALPKDEPPIHFAFSPDGAHLAAVIEEDDLHVFEVASGKLERTLDHYWPSRVAWSPDGATLASARGPALRLWDARTGKPRFAEFEGHTAPVTSVAITRDGKLAATGGEDVRIWEVASGHAIHRIAVNHGASALAFSPDGSKLASAGSDRIVHVWDARTGQSASELRGHKHPIVALAWSSDGRRIASGDTQATLRLWEVATSSEMRVIDMKSLADKLALAFSPDGTMLACGGAWNDTSFLPEGGIDIQSVSVAPKHGYAALLWTIDTDGEPRRFEGLSDNIRSATFSNDGTQIAAASRDGHIAIWDVASGKDRLYILAHPDPGRAAAVDALTGAYPSLVFGHDGTAIVSASGDGTIRRFDARTGKELQRFEAPASIHAIALAADGRTLVSGSADSTAIVWDLSTDAPPRPSNTSHHILIGD